MGLIVTLQILLFKKQEGLLLISKIIMLYVGHFVNLEITTKVMLIKLIGIQPEYKIKLTEVLLNYGGIYLDTDVELLKSFNELINNYSFFIGYETNCWFGCAVLGSKKGHPIMKEVFSRYEKPCKKIDRKSNMLCVLNFSASIKRLYNIKLDGKKRIVNNGVILLPREYFFPKHYITKELKITPNTISIHHYGSTWHSKAKMLGVKVASGMVHLLGDHAFGMCFETLARANMLGQLKREYKKFHKNRGIKSYE